jgi:NADPH-dependent 2,4-dienoyl-CoA reductase/sulfur reductase-like enzyme
MHLVVIGGSDAGISAALRAQELEPDAEITVLVADDYPNFSICGLPYFLSGETPDWHALAHRSEFPGLNISATTSGSANRCHTQNHFMRTRGSGDDDAL